MSIINRWTKLVLLVGILAGIGLLHGGTVDHAAAQAGDPAGDSTPEPTVEVPAFVYSWQSRLIYPAAVRFNLVLDRPLAEIESAALTILADGSTPQRITLPPEDLAIFTDAYTELEYVWALDPANPPLLFSTLRYTWDIALEDGETAAIPGQLPFSDDRLTWRFPDAEVPAPIGLIVPEANGYVPETLQARIARVYTLLTAQRGGLPDYRFVLYFEDTPLTPCAPDASGRFSVEDPDPNRETRYTCPPDIIERLFQRAGLLPLEIAVNNLASIDTAIVDYVVAQAYQPVWDAGGLPEWFRFGITRFYLPASKGAFLAQIQAAVREGRTYSLNAMDLPAGSSAEARARLTEDGLWQAQAYSMVLYIGQQIGVAQLLALANPAGTDAPFAERYAQFSGQSLNALLPNLENWVFTEVAVSDFDYTPYLPITPQPTPSRTATPFPVTATYTASATATDTPTPTVTGVHSPTPLPTLTATPTFTRAPRTPTPRPFSSLFTATPVPVPPAPTDSGPDQRVIALGAIGLLAVVGLALIVLVTATPRPRRSPANRERTNTPSDTPTAH